MSFLAIISPRHSSDNTSGLHVALILDGNGRWAQAQGKPRIWGHTKGAQTLKRLITACPAMGIKYLTVFAFSTENWKRPVEEVQHLWSLVASYLRKERNTLHQNNVCLKIIGDRAPLSPKVLTLIDETEALTQDNTGLFFQVALNYGGRHEIVSAAQKVMRLAQHNHLDPETLTEAQFETFLQTFPYPDPHLLIRTGGELRLSNYLLWQLSYTELVFSSVYWPDFTVQHLQDALDGYFRRTRTFGGGVSVPSL